MSDSRLRAFYSDQFELPLPPEHRFPMAKYRLLRDRVAEGKLAERVSLHVPDPATDEQIELVHHREYLQKLGQGTLTPLEQRRIGFPWSPQLVERSRRSTGATIAAGRVALEEGLAANLAGGTHHAFAEGGQGFCVLNDVAVAIRVLQAERRIERAVVIDLDVHQGNGTAAIFQGEPRVFTFSMHGDRNYPFRKWASDLDVPLPDRTCDKIYLARLREHLHCDLPLPGADCVFYLAGADPYLHDRYGRLSLTKAGLSERDRLVIDTCREWDLPLVIVMAGGYARQLEDIIDIHEQTIALAAAARRD